MSRNTNKSYVILIGQFVMRFFAKVNYVSSKWTFGFLGRAANRNWLRTIFSVRINIREYSMRINDRLWRSWWLEDFFIFVILLWKRREVLVKFNCTNTSQMLRNRYKSVKYHLKSLAKPHYLFCNEHQHSNLFLNLDLFKKNEPD